MFAILAGLSQWWLVEGEIFLDIFYLFYGWGRGGDHELRGQLLMSCLSFRSLLRPLGHGDPRFFGLRQGFFTSLCQFLLGHTHAFVYLSTSVWICDILVRIRIRGSLPLTHGSGSGACSFRLFFLSFKMAFKKKNFTPIFFWVYFAYYHLEVHLQQSLKIKSHEEVIKQ